MKLKNLIKNISLVFIFLAMILSCQNYTKIENSDMYHYWVEHYLQNANDDEYTRVDIEKESVLGYESEVKYTSTTGNYYKGFIVQPITPMEIANDGSTVVKIYYDRRIITLKLDLDGGEGTTEIRGRYGATVTAPTAPTKAGYIFAGWSNSWSNELPSTFPSQGETYTAQWVKLYTITYDLAGGSWENGFTPTKVCKENTEIILPTFVNTKKENYIFAGWYDENGDRIKPIPSDTAENITITAKWAKTPPEGFAFVQGATTKDKKIIPNLYVCDHEVTQAEYEEYCSYTYTDDANRTPSSRYGVGDNYPAYNVSWFDTLVYCNKRSIAEGLTPCYTINSSTDPADWGDIPYLSSHENLASWETVACDFTANGYRLPTSDEWVYAASGGNVLFGTQYTYAGSDIIDEVAWYQDNSGSKAHEVKGKKPNDFGLYDMSGNVWEWCWWEYNDDLCMNFGGSWNRSAEYCTVSPFDYQFANAYFRYYNTIGFRVVRTAIVE